MTIHALAAPVSYYRAATTVQAVRFDASAEKYSRTATGLGGVDHTVCCWVKLAADRNTNSIATSIDNASALYVMMGTTSSGTLMKLDCAAGGNNLVDMTVGVWYFCSYVFPIAHLLNKQTFYALEGAGSLTASTLATINTDPTDACTFIVGNNGFNNWLNGSIAQLRVWSAALTSTELLAEYHSTTPVRTSNLWAAYSFASGPQTTDDSGNGRTLTATGTPTADTAGPNIT